MNTPEYQEKKIQGWYQRFLRRPATPEEVARWEYKGDSVILDLVTSREYFNLAQSCTLSPSIELFLSLTRATPGSPVTVRARFLGGTGARLARILFRDCEVLHGLAEVPVGLDGTLTQTITIPEEATPGPHEIIVMGTGLNPPMGIAIIDIDLPPPSTISGVVTVWGRDGRMRPSPDTTVMFVRPGGGIVRTSVSDGQGRFSLRDIFHCGILVAMRAGAVFQQLPVDPPPGGILRDADLLGIEFGQGGQCQANNELNRFGGVQMFASIGTTTGGGRKPCQSTAIPIGQFASMPGRGVPVINRFSALVPFTVFPANGESVQFQFHAGGQLVKQVTAQLSQGQWMADVDMSEFPASTSRYEVRTVVNYRNARNQLDVCAFDPTLSFRMIDVPWFNSWMAQRQVRFNAGAKQYEFSAVLPGVPAFRFNEPIDLEVITLENRGTFGLPMSEILKIDGTWQGTAEAKVELILLGVNVLKEAFDVDTIQRSYIPSGGPYPDHTYRLDTIEIDLGLCCMNKVISHTFPLPQRLGPGYTVAFRHPQPDQATQRSARNPRFRLLAGRFTRMELVTEERLQAKSRGPHQPTAVIPTLGFPSLASHLVKATQVLISWMGRARTVAVLPDTGVPPRRKSEGGHLPCWHRRVDLLLVIRPIGAHRLHPDSRLFQQDLRHVRVVHPGGGGFFRLNLARSFVHTQMQFAPCAPFSTGVACYAPTRVGALSLRLPQRFQPDAIQDGMDRALAVVGRATVRVFARRHTVVESGTGTPILSRWHSD